MKRIRSKEDTQALLFKGGKVIILKGQEYFSQGKLYDTESGETSYFIDYVSFGGEVSRGIVDASDFEVVDEED